MSPLALHQEGKTIYEGMADRPLRAGDVILVHGSWEQLHNLQEHHQNFIIISQRETEFLRPEKTKSAVISFSLALALMLVSSLYFQHQEYNPIPLSVCLMIGAVGMVLGGVMTITEAPLGMSRMRQSLMKRLFPTTLM